MEAKEELLKADGLYKIYHGHPVVRDVNLVLYRGECVIVSGDNGSGKSTLLGLFAGLIRPTKGEVSIRRKTSLQYVPVMTDGRFYLSAWEFLINMALIDGYSLREAQSMCRGMFHHYRMTGLEKHAVNRLSGGDRQKLILCQALLKPCDFLVMDEPLLGLDLRTQDIFFRDFVKMKEQRTTILMTCHEEGLERARNTIADRVLHLRHGSIKEEADESASKV